MNWEPIASAPKDGALVIVALIRGRIWRVSDAAFNGIGWYTRNGDSCHWATHWIALPPVPEEAQSE